LVPMKSLEESEEKEFEKLKREREVYNRARSEFEKDLRNHSKDPEERLVKVVEEEFYTTYPKGNKGELQVYAILAGQGHYSNSEELKEQFEGLMKAFNRRVPELKCHLHNPEMHEVIVADFAKKYPGGAPEPIEKARKRLAREFADRRREQNWIANEQMIGYNEMPRGLRLFFKKATGKTNFREKKVDRLFNDLRESLENILEDKKKH